jgi:NhaP-type Na+/H+ or K+/H+ antiporter
MTATPWFLVVGVLLLGVAIGGSLLQRLPLTTSLLYLVAGVALGPYGLGLLDLDPREDAALIGRLTEVVLLISLFTAGLKLRNPWNDRRWRLPVRLATTAMVLTIAFIAVVGVAFLALPLGAAVLLGAIIAPTDPVLASDVQVESVADRDRLRFALTGEAGLNDGTAFPFVMLGLGLLGLHELGELSWRWVAIDVVWAVGAGLAIGWLVGTMVGRVVLYLRQTHREAVGLDELLALGLIALAYGLALLTVSSGFLAVFAAGLAIRRVERRETSTNDARTRAPADVVAAATSAQMSAATEGATQNASAEPVASTQLATDVATAPAYMAEASLGFTQQLERLGEFVVVLLLGSMLGPDLLAPEAIWFVPLLFLVIRPLAIMIGAPMRKGPRPQRLLASWFGIRGIGSVYYLMYASQHALPTALGERLAAITLSVVAASIVVHGISVTPLMRAYSRQEGRKRSAGTRD